MPAHDAITEHDLLTWELQLKREGTLPPEVQVRMLEYLADRTVAVPIVPRRLTATKADRRAERPKPYAWMRV